MNIYQKIKLGVKQNLFFLSDSHFGHRNIVRGVSQWDQNERELNTRDFDTIDEMNDAIVNGINKYVREDDVLFHLGDWSFGGHENIRKFRERLIVKNIFLILGNHDQHIIRKPEYQELFTEISAYKHLTVSDEASVLKKPDRTYILFHFPISVWDSAHKNIPLLHGHTHSSFQGKGRILDVGIDNAFKLFGEYRPFSEQDVIKYMKDKTFIQQSHHNINTN